MRGDFSRRTDDPRKHYSAVLQEQGRLLTDADLEEEHRILTRAHERTAADVVGGCGGPIGAAGFGISVVGGDLEISAGRYYAGGRLVVNEEAVGFLGQPHRYLDAPTWPPAVGRYAVVLDVWSRLVTALDDPSIREVALGGPTTAAREQTVWQVRLLATDDDAHCASDLPEEPSTTGRLAARAEPEATVATPCLVPPLAGFAGLENQFYRVEVFATGDAVDVGAAEAFPIVGYPAGTTDQVELSAADAGALAVGEYVEVVATDGSATTFAQVSGIDGAVVSLSGRLPEVADDAELRRVSAAAVFSRENGSVVTAITAIDGSQVTVTDVGPDDVLGFAPGQWVELSDDAVEFEALPRQLRQVESIDTDRRIVTLRTPADPLALTGTGVDPARNPRLRRWEGARGIGFAGDGSEWIHLESGIEVRFTDGEYLSGDYWHFPARAAIVDEASGTIAWPDDGGVPAESGPVGVQHHRCRLAILDVNPPGGTPLEVVADCRHLFPPVTELTTLLYVGGDGQEARPDTGLTLPAPLIVRVANGAHPVEGARVVFTGDGAQSQPEDVTDEQGLASSTWTLDSGVPAQTCVAVLLGPDGVAIPHQLVQFAATLDRGGDGRRGCCSSVGPGGDFETLRDAIGALLERGERDLCLCLMPGDHASGELDLSQRDGRDLHLSIKGSGRGTRLRLEGMLLREWRSLRLGDLDVVLPPGASIHTVGVDEVRLENVRVFGDVDEGAGIVRIHDALRVHVGRSELRIRPGLEIDGLRAVFAETGVLAEIWDRLERERPDLDTDRLASLLGDLALEERGRASAILLRIISGRLTRFPAEVFAAFERFAGTLASDAEPGAMAADLAAIVAALAAWSGRVALEIGTTDEGQDELRTRQAADVIVEDSLIAGALSFYGRAGGDPLTDEERRMLRNLLIESMLRGWRGGTVHLRDNRIGAIVLSRGMLDALHRVSPNGDRINAAYTTFLVTNNVIAAADSAIVAGHVAVVGNDFTLSAVLAPTAPTILLGVLGDTALASGNRGARVPGPNGPTPALIERTLREWAESANIEIGFV